MIIPDGICTNLSSMPGPNRASGPKKSKKFVVVGGLCMPACECGCNHNTDDERDLPADGLSVEVTQPTSQFCLQSLHDDQFKVVEVIVFIASFTFRLPFVGSLKAVINC